MQKLIDDILQFSSLNADASSFEKVDLDAILNNVLSDIEIKIEESGALIKREPLLSIEAIPSQMGQLFQNLISNAIKFHKPGSVPEVSVRCRLISKEIVQEDTALLQSKSFIEIDISDNGIGFDESYKEKIFEIFQRLHNSKTYSGTGIGLAICKKIVDNHLGTIRVASEPGVGTTFTIQLPVVHPGFNVPEKAQ
jgi:signal transduction histidine kinase